MKCVCKCKTTWPNGNCTQCGGETELSLKAISVTLACEDYPGELTALRQQLTEAKGVKQVDCPNCPALLKLEQENKRLRKSDVSQGMGDMEVLRVDGDPTGRLMPDSITIKSDGATVTYVQGKPSRRRWRNE